MATGPKGEKHLCGACGQWHAPHRPDNCIQVPVCQTCWKLIPLDTRVWALSLAKMTSRVDALDNTLHELLDGVVEAIAASKKTGGGYSDN